MAEAPAPGPRCWAVALLAGALLLFLFAATASAANTATTSKTAAAAKAHTKKAARHKAAPKPAPLTPLTGWLGNGATFPNRVLVLATGPRETITPTGLRVAENGSPISPFSLTPVAQAAKGDFGAMLVVDQSMATDGLAGAVSGARAFAAHRSAGQELGLVTFASSPALVLPLSTDQQRIGEALATPPAPTSGSDVGAATQMALSQLIAAKVALGTVVVITDGAAATAADLATPPAAVAAAAATHTSVITIGVKDKSATPASLAALAKASPGQFVATTPARLPAVLTAISQLMDRDYLVRYRSRAADGNSVAVTAQAAGIPGTAQTGYQTPTPPPSPAPAVVVHGPAARHAHRPDFSNTTLLSPYPSFGNPPAPPAATTRGSFWASSAAGPAVAAACSLLLAIAILLALYRPSRRAVRLRVGSFIPGPEGETASQPTAQADREKSTRTSIFQRSTWWPPFVEAVEIARSPHTPIYLVKRAAVIGVLSAALLTVATGSVLPGLAALLAWPFVLRSLMLRAAEKQRAKFRDGLPAYLQDLASSIRVGRSFVGALSVIAESADEPTRSELERAVTDEALGRPLEESLEAVARRMGSTDMDQVALIAGLNRKSGSNVAESLDRVAEGSRDRADLRREMKALTAQAKMSSSVLTGLPGFLMVGLAVLSPQYAHPLLHTTGGIISLVVGSVLVLIGWKVMQRITNIEGV